MRSGSHKRTPAAWASDETPTVAVEPDTLDAMLRRVVQPRPGDNDAPFLVVGSWNSRTATLYRCRGAGASTDVVVKVGEGWHSSDAFDAFDATTRLDQMLSSGRCAARVPAPLGWDTNPPAVLSRHVDGTDLFFMMRDAAHEAWRSTTWSPDEIAGECGRALGVFHSSARVESGGADGLHEVAHAMRLEKGIVDELEIRLVKAPAFGDFGVHQFRLGADDVLYLLDPPTEQIIAPVHRDLSAFAFHLTKLIETDSPAPPRSEEALCDSFYYGYSETGPTDPTTPLNRWVLRVFEGHKARGLAHKRLRAGEPLVALKHGADYLQCLAATHFRRPQF
ncbi:MAG: hypothetical protein ACRDKT_02470 [Actinomycetota bacterium]